MWRRRWRLSTQTDSKLHLLRPYSKSKNSRRTWPHRPHSKPRSRQDEDLLQMSLRHDHELVRVRCQRHSTSQSGPQRPRWDLFPPPISSPRHAWPPRHRLWRSSVRTTINNNNTGECLPQAPIGQARHQSRRDTRAAISQEWAAVEWAVPLLPWTTASVWLLQMLREAAARMISHLQLQQWLQPPVTVQTQWPQQQLWWEVWVVTILPAWPCSRPPHNSRCLWGHTVQRQQLVVRTLLAQVEAAAILEVLDRMPATMRPLLLSVLSLLPWVSILWILYCTTTRPLLWLRPCRLPGWPACPLQPRPRVARTTLRATALAAARTPPTPLLSRPPIRCWRFSDKLRPRSNSNVSISWTWSRPEVWANRGERNKKNLEKKKWETKRDGRKKFTVWVETWKNEEKQNKKSHFWSNVKPRRPLLINF